MDYFGKKQTSGMFTSRGFSYQDHCAVIALLEHSVNDGFCSITTETLDDITVIYDSYEIYIQVKKKHLTIKDFNELLPTIQDGCKEIVFSSTNQDFGNLIIHKLRLLQTLQSHRSQKVKQQHRDDFEALLLKKQIRIPIDLFITTTFTRRSESDIQSVLWHVAYKWSKQHLFELDIEEFTNDLVFKIYQLRDIGGELKHETLFKIADRCSLSGTKTPPTVAPHKAFLDDASQLLKQTGISSNKELVKGIEDKLELASSYIKATEYSKALEIYSALALIYEQEQLILQCALLCTSLEKYQTGIEYADKLLALNVDHWDALCTKAECLEGLNEPDEALRYFHKALTLKADFILYYNIGWIYHAQKEYDEAIKFYQKSIIENNAFASVHQNISVAYYHTGSYQPALQHVIKAIELAPDVPFSHFHKAKILKYLGIYDDAILSYQECLRLTPDYKQALLGLGLCKLLTGHEEGMIFISEWAQDKVKNGHIKEKVLYVDIGYKCTVPMTIEPLPDNKLRIQILGYEEGLEVHPGEGVGFVGIFAPPNADRDQLYPIIGKQYIEQKEYKKITKEILERSDLAITLNPVTGSILYIDPDTVIRVEIFERADYVYFKIDFNGFLIGTETDHGHKTGFKAFTDNLSKHSDFTIQLSCRETEETFVIIGVKKSQIKIHSFESC